MVHTRTTITTAAGVLVAGSALFASPALAATDGPAAPSGSIAVKTSVTGNTLTYTLSVWGNQSQFVDSLGVAFWSPEAEFTRIDFGDGTTPIGSDGGDEHCRPGTPTKPFTLTMPTMRHTYAKPGTYTLTARSAYCGANGDTPLMKKYTVTIPAAGTSTTQRPTTLPGSATHKAPATHAPATTTGPATQTAPAAPAAKAPTGAGSAVGPKVQTDRVAAADDTTLIAAAGAGLATVLAGAGLLARRRQR